MPVLCIFTLRARSIQDGNRIRIQNGKPNTAASRKSSAAEDDGTKKFHSANHDEVSLSLRDFAWTSVSLRRQTAPNAGNSRRTGSAFQTRSTANNPPVSHFFRPSGTRRI